MPNGIRPYGPGKFNTLIDSYVYDISLNGADDEAGDVQYSHHYTLLRGSFKLEGAFVDFVPEVLNDLTAAERQLLSTTAGVILSEDSQGFVHVEYFNTLEALETAWAECVAATSDVEGDE